MPGKGLAGLHHVDGKRMIVVLGVHRTHHAKIIGKCRQMGYHLRKLHAALTVLFKSKGTPQQNVLVSQLEGFHLFRVGLPLASGQFRLGIKQVHLGRTTVLKELDYRFGFCGKVARSRRQIVPILLLATSQQPRVLQESGQGDGPKAAAHGS